MTTVQAKRLSPGTIDAELAKRAKRRIADYLTSNPDAQQIRVTGELAGEHALVLPREVVDLLAFILIQAAQGRGVNVMPLKAELTTQQAADILNVSRPYLIGLLEDGKIPYRLVGRHRRIRYEDLLDYQRRDDAERRAAADELSVLG
ncbi:DNA-binding protein [Actinomadura sp. KC216]|uniref:helix-turn-helix domain-containing protein n=1 Tax=Actinomadura sp. KC216 TaxID=2530370 RepID=UPI00104DFBC1|nr:helix-turn-helix domain-containing protein [Actinomadura sp. KC216]TDB90795.1 DNA-binding protein [Actinomadura sp. KC216]